MRFVSKNTSEYHSLQRFFNSTTKEYKLKLSELVNEIEQQNVQHIFAELGELEYEKRKVRVKGEEYQIDDSGLNELGKYLDIPKNYLPKLSEDLTKSTINYFQNKNDEAPTLFEIENGYLTSVYKGSRHVFPKVEIARALQRATGPSEGEIRSLSLVGPELKVSFTTETFTTEPREGDITEGGLKLDAHVQEFAPKISSFMRRLVCRNGMIVEEPTGLMRIRGNTVDDIIEEMEVAARKLLNNNVPEYLHLWGAMDQQGAQNPEQLIHRLCREHGISAKIQDRIIEAIPSLGLNPSMYDLINLITSFQNEGVRATQAEKLQLLGGAAITGAGEHRCSTCAHALA